MDYTAVIIDGAVPHNPNERCMRLLDHSHGLLLDRRPALFNWALERWNSLIAEVTTNWDDDEYDWYDLEDEIIEFINQMLPDDVFCCVHPDDPGTVVIWDKHEIENQI